MSRRFQVVVAGAGMVGLALAALLARSRHQAALDVTVVDAGPRPDFDSTGDVDLRVSAVSLGSARILSDAGAWPEIAAIRASSFEGMRVWDARTSVDGPETLVFDAADFAVPELGFIVENALIRHALLQVVAQGDTDLRFSTAIEDLQSLDDDGGSRVELTLATGERLRPDLVPSERYSLY